MLDIEVEHARGELLRQPYIDALVAEGISPLALTQTASGIWSMVRRDRVIFDDDRFAFERDRPEIAGRGALTFVCYDDVGEPVDIAAWNPPDIALWLGRVYALGQENAYAPRLTEPLFVHRSVTDWFRCGRSGLFIIAPAEAAIALRNETLGVEKEDHARDLRALLTLRSPPVVVTEAVVAA